LTARPAYAQGFGGSGSRLRFHLWLQRDPEPHGLLVHAGADLSRKKARERTTKQACLFAVGPSPASYEATDGSRRSRQQMLRTERS